MGKNILITGAPGTGKTTLVRRLCQEGILKDTAGFYTEEIKHQNRRQGFRLVGINTEASAVLAHINIKSPYRVSRYGVDINSFEKFLCKIEPLVKEAKTVVIDEIGKMECFSEKFISLMEELLSGPQVVLATVALKGGGFIEEVKKRPDIEIFHLTPENRERVFNDLSSLILSSGLKE